MKEQTRPSPFWPLHFRFLTPAGVSGKAYRTGHAIARKVLSAAGMGKLYNPESFRALSRPGRV
jgi:hypothetical protein